MGIENAVDQLGRTLMNFIPFFKLYSEYIKKYRKSLKFLSEQREKVPRLDKFLVLHEKIAGTKLTTLLQAPVTRLPQYIHYLGAVHRGLEPDCEAAISLEGAVKAVLGITQKITIDLRDQSRRKLVVTLQQVTFKGSVDLVSPHR